MLSSASSKTTRGAACMTLYDFVTKFLAFATYLAWFCTDTIQSFSFMIDSMAKEYFDFLNKYLATFKGLDDASATIGDPKEEAVAAIIEFVKSSNLFQVLVYSSSCIWNINSMRIIS